MLVTDQLTGEKRPKEELYCVTTIGLNGKKSNKYYTSESAYKKWKLNSEYRTKCISKMYDLLGYETYMKIPTFFYKKLTQWEPYGFDVVSLCIDNKSRDIIWAINNKEFRQETSKIMYICAILENGMNDALKQKVREEKMMKDNRKQSDTDLVDIDINNRKQVARDISSFLDED